MLCGPEGVVVAEVPFIQRTLLRQQRVIHLLTM